MNKKGLIIRELAKKYNKDVRVIQQMVESPFKFTNRVIQDPYDKRPVRLRYFAVFMQKESYNKEMRLKDMVKVLLDNIYDVLIVMASILGYQIDTQKSAKRIIEDAVRDKDYEKIKTIYDAYKEWSK